MTRPAKVIIDGHAAKKNLETTRLHCPQSKILAVIKADAYGHGL
ncbi:MAG: alanine racemase, partial [Proteobacteria bacterium]|nr:alanine racemase [Pseudomonadota bacterium]